MEIFERAKIVRVMKMHRRIVFRQTDIVTAQRIDRNNAIEAGNITSWVINWKI